MSSEIFEEPALLAIQKGKTRCLEVLLDKKLPITWESNGKNLLELAISSKENRAATVKILLERGIDTTKQDSDGMTSGKYTVVELICIMYLLLLFLH